MIINNLHLVRHARSNEANAYLGTFIVRRIFCIIILSDVSGVIVQREAVLVNQDELSGLKTRMDNNKTRAK